MYNFVERNMVANNVNKNEYYYDERKQGTMNYLGTLSPATSSVDSSDVKMHSPMSQGMNATDLIYNSNMMLLEDSNGIGLHNLPYLQILEEPIEKFRFRYKSEMVGTHGSLNGMNSDKIRKNTYPSVQLLNYEGTAMIRCSIFQMKPVEQPHAHRLVIKAGNGEKDDPHDIEVSPERGYTAIFQGMGIIHTAKKHLIPELVKKKTRLMQEQIARMGHCRKLNQMEEADIFRQAEVESKGINLNTVRLRFEAFKVENGVLLPLCAPVYSHGINNLKSALTGELKIVRMDHTITSCVGGQEIFILVEKVTKNNIKVRFFECDDDDNEIWSDYGRFSHIDVHHQYAIVFKAPPYKDLNIESTVEVCLELVRPSDGARSEPRVFKYKPSDKVGRKRAHYSDSFSSNELPTTIPHKMSFGSSISVSDSLIINDPEFFKNFENINTDLFDDLYKQALPEYQNLTTDGPTSTVCLPTNTSIKMIDAETEKMAKRVVTDLTALLKQNPSPETVEKHVRNSFRERYTADGNNALHTAILCEQYTHLQYILVLLSKMKHLKIVDIQNNAGETALHLAIKINNPTVVGLLLPVGANPNLVDNKGNTPLHVAVKNDFDLDEYQHLVDVTDIDTENDGGYTALHLAVLNGNLNAARILVKANANVNHKHPSNGYTPLHMAIEEKSATLVRYLLEETSARLDDENFTHTTPVHMAKVLADTEGKASEKIFEIISNYIKNRGFESLMIKTEPEDEDSSSDSDVVTIKSEPSTEPEEMEVEVENEDILTLKDKEFTKECIFRLGVLLDGSTTLQKLVKDLDFESIGASVEISTKMLLNYANVTARSVYEVRQFLSSYDAQGAVNVIDNHYLKHK